MAGRLPHRRVEGDSDARCDRGLVDRRRPPAAGLVRGGHPHLERRPRRHRPAGQGEQLSGAHARSRRRFLRPHRRANDLGTAVGEPLESRDPQPAPSRVGSVTRGLQLAPHGQAVDPAGLEDDDSLVLVHRLDRCQRAAVSGPGGLLSQQRTRQGLRPAGAHRLLAHSPRPVEPCPGALADAFRAFPHGRSPDCPEQSQSVGAVVPPVLPIPVLQRLLEVLGGGQHRGVPILQGRAEIGAVGHVPRIEAQSADAPLVGQSARPGAAVATVQDHGQSGAAVEREVEPAPQLLVANVRRAQPGVRRDQTLVLPIRLLALRVGHLGAVTSVEEDQMIASAGGPDEVFLDLRQDSLPGGLLIDEQPDLTGREAVAGDQHVPDRAGVVDASPEVAPLASGRGSRVPGRWRQARGGVVVDPHHQRAAARSAFGTRLERRRRELQRSGSRPARLARSARPRAHAAMDRECQHRRSEAPSAKLHLLESTVHEPISRVSSQAAGPRPTGPGGRRSRCTRPRSTGLEAPSGASRAAPPAGLPRPVRPR